MENGKWNVVNVDIKLFLKYFFENMMLRNG